jgi:selenophosphate synthetase-related protein
VAVVVDVLSFEATRQVDVLHEHVPRVNALPIAWIGASTAASAQVTRVVVAIPGIVAPSRIVTSHGAPP